MYCSGPNDSLEQEAMNVGAERIHNRGEAVVGEKVKVKGKDVWVNVAVPGRPGTDEWIRGLEEGRVR